MAGDRHFYGIEVHENDDFHPWLKCTFFCIVNFNEFVMNNPDIALSTFSFFQYTSNFYQVPSLLP
jgi:hypothetical protein